MNGELVFGLNCAPGCCGVCGVDDADAAPAAAAAAAAASACACRAAAAFFDLALGSFFTSVLGVFGDGFRFRRLLGVRESMRKLNYIKFNNRIIVSVKLSLIHLII